MNTVAEAVLFIMMTLTVIDVVFRALYKPIVGTYELVAISGAIVIGFAVPRTSWEKGHVYVDFLVERRSDAVRKGFFIATRLVGIVLFALLSWNLFVKGAHLQKGGEVSMTLHIPYYPAAYGLAFCFLVESLVLMADIARIFAGENRYE